MKKKWIIKEIISLLLVISLNFPCLADNKKAVKIDTAQSLIFTKAGNNLEDLIEKFQKETKIIESPTEFKDNKEKLKDIFFSTISEAKSMVRETQEDLQKTSSKSRFLLSSQVFFNDINIHYENKLEEIQKIKDERDEYIKIREDVIKTLKDNQLAYETVASADRLTFNLKVITFPKGATVHYWRTGTNFEIAKETILTLENLDYAKWNVRVHVDGYVDEEKQYNPFRETSSELQFDLKPIPTPIPTE